MGELADGFSDFLTVLPIRDPGLADHLRLPQQVGSTIRGSQIGAALWAQPQGQRLLELVDSDQAVRAAIGTWPRIPEIRMTIGSAVLAWQNSGQPIRAFADANEEPLWTSLRRMHIQSAAIR